MRRWIQFSVLMAVMALVAAACSNEGGETTTTAADTTTTTQAATTTTEAPTTTEGDSLVLGPGVTEEPCPGGDPDRGCIYLGVLTDESGPFAAAAPGLFGGQQAFWAVANATGGIGGAFDVAVPAELKRDMEYDPQKMVEQYAGISADVAAIAQSLGTPQTIAAIPGYQRDSTVAAPMSWWSGWAFSETAQGGAYTGDDGLVIEFGTNYCFEAMNAVDWAVQAFPAQGRTVETVGILEFPTDYGFDYAAGVKAAAEANGLTVAWEAPVIPISAGGDAAQVEAVNQVVSNPVDIVFLVTGPTETAVIVAGSVLQGFQGLFIGAAPSWNVGLLASDAAPIFAAGVYFQSSYVGGWDYDSPGHAALRAAIEAAGFPANDFFISGWVSQYGLKAALEAAYAAGDLSHAGIANAARNLSSVDYQGMMPSRDFQGDPADVFPRQSLVGAVDTEAATGISVVQDFFVGPTAEAYDFSAPCSQVGG